MNDKFSTINTLVKGCALSIFTKEFKGIPLSEEAFNDLWESNKETLKVALSVWLATAYDAWDYSHADYVIEYFSKVLPKVSLTELISALVECDEIVTSSIPMTRRHDMNQYITVTDASITSIKPFLAHMSVYATHPRTLRTFILFLKRFSFNNDPRFLERSYQAFLETEQQCKATNEHVDAVIQDTVYAVASDKVFISLSAIIEEAQKVLAEMYADFVEPWPDLVLQESYSSGMFPQLSRYNKEHKTSYKSNRFIKRLVAAANDATFCCTPGIPAPYNEEIIEVAIDGVTWKWIKDETMDNTVVDVVNHLIIGKRNKLKDNELRELNYCYHELGMGLVILGTHDVPEFGNDEPFPSLPSTKVPKDYEVPFDSVVCAPAVQPALKVVNIENRWMVDDGCTMIIAVPKDYKSARIVGMESPNRSQWLAAGTTMMRLCRLASNWRKNITLENGEVSREAAHDLSIATLDLSSASDLLSRRVAEILLPKAVYCFIMKYRSEKFTIPELGITEIMEKWLPMGAPPCMDCQSAIYMALAIAILILDYRAGLIASYQELKKCVEKVVVHGDDQIVPAFIAETLMQVETDLGLKVNKAKSHWRQDDFYREACGGHWLWLHDEDQEDGKTYSYWYNIANVFWPRRGKEVTNDADLEQMLTHLQHNVVADEKLPFTNEFIRAFLGQTKVCESYPTESDGFWSESPVITVAPAAGREQFDWQYREVQLMSALTPIKVSQPFYPEEVEMYQYEDALRGLNRTTEEIRMPDGSLARFTYVQSHTPKVPSKDLKLDRTRRGWE